jgi:hypothetical protein
MTFRYWLNAKFLIDHRIGKVNFIGFSESEEINYQNFMIHDLSKFKYKKFDNFQNIEANSNSNNSQMQQGIDTGLESGGNNSMIFPEG